MNKKETFKIIGVLVFTIFTTFLSAQSEAKEVTSTHFIKNANVVQKPGMVLPITNVLIKNGIIEAIGPNVTAPFDANIIDADSMYVYAGFIDAGSHTGIPKKEASRQRPEGVKPANPPNNVAGITPEAKAIDVISPKEKSISEMRTNGFVISHVLPSGRMLPGKGAIISNHGTAINDMVINGESSMFSQFTGAPRVYPATVIGIMAKWRDLYNNSKNMNAYAAKYTLNPTGKNRPNMDAATEAMGSVVNKDLAVYFKANKAMDAHRALQLQKDLGFNIVLIEVEQAYPLVDIISSKNIPVLLSAKLPKEDKKDEKKDEKKGDEKKDEKKGDAEKAEKKGDTEKAKKKDLEKEGLMMRKKKKRQTNTYNRQECLRRKE